MRVRYLAAFLVLLVAATLPASMGEVIYFTNGTTMEAASVEYTEGMIHVILDEDAKFAFPSYLVERVEKSDAKAGIRGRGSRGRKSTRSNVSSASGRVSPRAATTRPSGNAIPRGKIETGDDGLTTERPFADSKHPGRSQLRLTGSQAARDASKAGGRQRTRNGRAGAGAGKTVLPSHRSRQREAQQGPDIRNFEFDPKNRPATPKPPKTDNQGSNQDGSDN